MKSFAIPEGPSQLTVALGGGAPAIFSVNNLTQESLRGRLSVQTTGGAALEWFVIDGDKERMFAVGSTHTVNVTATPPPGTAAGDYRFRLRVAALNDPDNDTAESPPVTLTIKGEAPKPGFPGWAIALIVALVVLVLIVAGYFMLRHSSVAPHVTPPPVATMPRLIDPAAPIDEAAARQLIAAAAPGLKVTVTPTPDSPTAPPGTVAMQAPPAGTPLTPGTAVSFGISTPWFFGTWSGTIDGRPATMRWSAPAADHAIVGEFSDGSTGRYVPLTHDSHNGDKIFFRHADGNSWFLGRTSDGEATGWTTWQGHQYPLVMSRRALTIAP